MYWLSELHGRLGQILREYGDMPVVRRRDLHIDGSLSTDPSKAFIDYSNEDIGIMLYGRGENKLIINIARE